MTEKDILPVGTTTAPRLPPLVQPWVRVIIVNYNAGDWLQRAVDALALQTDAAFEAVIVDNASSDTSATALNLPDARFSLLYAGDNIGFAAGCNLGAKGANTPFLAMLNPDALAAPDWLEKLRAATARYPDAAAFGSTQIQANNHDVLDGGGDFYSIYGLPWRGGFGKSIKRLPTKDGRILSPCGAAALYRRDVYEQLGGFDERFFCYLEDVDLGLRIHLIGHDVQQIVDARVYHAGSVITGRFSAFTVYHSYRNRVWLLAKTVPLPLLFIMLPLHVAATGWLLGRKYKTASFSSALEGLKAGIKGAGSFWHDRQKIQSMREISLLQVAHLLIWNPAKVGRRQISYLK